MAQMTQEQMFYQAHKRLAKRDEAFMDAVKEGLTRKELESLIKRRPEVWGIYDSWLDKLPQENQW